MESYRFSVKIVFAIVTIFCFQIRTRIRITLIDDFSSRIYIYRYVVSIVKDNRTCFHK